MESVDINILEIIWHSGFVVKFVLLLLLVASVASWAIIFKKRSLFMHISENNKKFFDVYQNAENMEDVMEQCSSLPFSPFKVLFMHGFGELIKVNQKIQQKHIENTGEYLKAHGTEFLSRGLKQGVNQVNEYIEKFLSILASIGSISPFIGLLGTVWGIIDSFTGLASGGATLDKVAPGIAEALVATAIGLFAAIPAVWFYNHYSNKITILNSQMESFGQDFLNSIERSLID